MEDEELNTNLTANMIKENLEEFNRYDESIEIELIKYYMKLIKEKFGIR